MSANSDRMGEAEDELIAATPIVGAWLGAAFAASKIRAAARLSRLHSAVVDEDGSTANLKKMLEDNPEDAGTIIHDLLADHELEKASVYGRLLKAIQAGRLNAESKGFALRTVKDLTTRQIEGLRVQYVHEVNAKKVRLMHSHLGAPSLDIFDEQCLLRNGVIKRLHAGGLSTGLSEHTGISSRGIQLVECLWEQTELGVETVGLIAAKGVFLLVADLEVEEASQAIEAIQGFLKKERLVALPYGFVAADRLNSLKDDCIYLIGPKTSLNAGTIQHLNGRNRRAALLRYGGELRSAKDLGLKGMCFEADIDMENTSESISSILKTLVPHLTDEHATRPAT